MTKKQTIEIAEAKGRPMLHWVGKRPLDHVTAYPAQGDFISPTIVERLEMDTPLFKAQIPDWRAMVDVVMIDTAYDGEVFDITLSDVPERKDDLMVGRYELPAPEGETIVAVKIVDMLGEEVLVTEAV